MITVILIITAGPTLAQSPRPLKLSKDVTLIRKHSEAQGIDVKNLAKPENKDKISWQKVVVGQEQINGAQLIGLPKNSSWRRLGLQQGDVVLRVAGEDLNSEKDLDRALEKAQSHQTIDFKVLRQNTVLLIDYQIRW